MAPLTYLANPLTYGCISSQAVEAQAISSTLENAIQGNREPYYRPWNRPYLHQNKVPSTPFQAVCFISTKGFKWELRVAGDHSLALQGEHRETCACTVRMLRICCHTLARGRRISRNIKVEKLP